VLPAKLVQQPALAFLAPATVAPAQSFQLLIPFRRWLHVHCLFYFGVFFP